MTMIAIFPSFYVFVEIMMQTEIEQIQQDKISVHILNPPTQYVTIAIAFSQSYS